MKKLFKKVVSVGLTAALTLSMAITGISSASAANYAYGDYTTITNVPTRSNCYAMEALAVGSTYLYTVKVDLSTNKCAVISKINKNTGAITKLSTNSGATTFNYLGHANAMDVATVNGKSNLYISTMKAAKNNLVRMEVNGSKINKKGAFTIRKDGQPISMPCMAITANTSTTIEFLFSRGCTFYKGSINKNATSGYIDVSYAFKVNTKEVMINGKSTDLSAFCWQDFGYHNGKIFVALSGHTANKPNQSAAVVYDVENAKGTIKSVPNLSFFINSKAYPEKCEIEGCDISPSDGKLYFNTNRIKNGNGNNYDGVHVFKNYTYNESIFPQTTIGNVDVISGGTGCVTVRGWAFDQNATSTSTPVHVYIGGPAGSGEGHAITANTSRTDVNGVYGCGNNHGFDATISTSLTGSQPVYIYAINARKGTNRMIGSGTVNITAPTPSIYNYGIADLGTGFHARIGNVGSNKNVAVDLSNDNVIIWDKIANADQTWRFDRYADGSYKITNTYNGKCLDVAGCGNGDGVNVGLWSDLENSAQKWYIYNYGGNYVLKAACSDRVLDVAGGGSANFTNVHTWSFLGSGAQLFTIDKVNDYNGVIADLGTGFHARIGNVGSNKNIAIDLSNDNVILWDKIANADQTWRFDRYADGSYKITNTYNGECLDVSGCGNGDGVNVGLWKDLENSAQKWYIYNYCGKYVLKAVCSDRVLDVAGGGSANYTNIHTWTFNATGAQLFTIDKVDDYKGVVADLGTGFYARIGNVGSNKNVAIDLSNNNVILWDKIANADQTWRFDRYADGSYKITNTYNGECLDVSGCGNGDGVNVGLWKDLENSAQKWYIYNYCGKYVLKAVCSDRVLDVAGGASANYTNIQTWTFVAEGSQLFTIDKI